MDKNKFGHFAFTFDRNSGFEVWIINVQASVDRRPPRFVSQKFGHQSQWPGSTARERKLGRPRRLWGRKRELRRSRTAKTSTSWGALVMYLIIAVQLESDEGLMTDLIAKFAKNQVQKTLLPYFAAIGWVEF